MINLLRLMQWTLASSIVADGSAGAAAPKSASEHDPLYATLIASKEKNRGVTIHANGASIAMVVATLDEHYVIGRNQQTSRIVIRLDRIDGVSAAF